MAKELEELKKGKHQGIRKNPLGEINAPFSKRIREAGLPPKFRMPSEKYSRTEDLISHLESFVHQMEVQNATRSTMCRMFPSTLTDCAKTWFRKLPPAPKQVNLQAASYSLILRRYPTRRSPLRRSPPRAAPLKEVAQVAREEDIYNHYTPLNASRETIYLAIKDKDLLKKPGPMKVPTDRRNQYKYCDFHEDVRHNTSEFYNLRNQIEVLIRGGLLTEFLQQVRDSIKGKQVQSGMQDAADRRRDEENDLMQQIQVIHTISRGPTLDGTSNNSRKNHARKIPRLNAGHEIFKVSSGSRNPSRSTKIVFTEEDVYITVQPHDNPMVISVQIANCRVHRVLIYTGSSVDILFKGAHEQLNLKNHCYNSCTSLLYGFTEDSVMPMGSKILPVTIREASLQQNVMTEFIVVDTPSVYNAILGRRFLSGIRRCFMDVFSGYNQIMMHPTDQDNTNFITRQDLYCYKVMPFGLKNAGAIYQRMVNKLFKQQIGRSMEVYIDNMITKSLEAGQHPEDLRQTF
ncbi:hypothetical protein LWI28_012027 [Acer negundo]|uniref:Reverse transcriptase domain-containing protein n=1 Tax=Acer negundo TaxID=4023 RepID=A0AAD5J9Z2_ACENE|nr:hypothetical protein LWI28_012027 [Acer negundo]